MNLPSTATEEIEKADFVYDPIINKLVQKLKEGKIPNQDYEKMVDAYKSMDGRIISPTERVMNTLKADEVGAAQNTGPEKDR